MDTDSILLNINFKEIRSQLCRMLYSSYVYSEKKHNIWLDASKLQLLSYNFKRVQLYKPKQLTFLEIQHFLISSFIRDHLPEQ